MFLIYTDESGDTGVVNSPTRYYVLSALVVHESKWQDLLRDLIILRREFRNKYQLKLREEIHASHWFSKPGELARIPKHERLAICRHLIDFQEKTDYIKLLHVVVDKEGKDTEYDVFFNAWQQLIQRIDNTVWYGNFPYRYGNHKEYALLFPDRTDDKKLRTLIRKMRHYNPVPYVGGTSSRNLNMRYILEDPHMKESSHSYITQLVDVNAYFLYQMLNPNKYILKKKAHKYFMRLDTVLLKQASNKCRMGKGIVWI